MENNSCLICSQLKDVEKAFEKYGWPDLTVSLPEAFKELIPDSEETKYDRDKILKCPLCGTRYQYDEVYTSYTPSSEDDITLTRLTEAKSSPSDPASGH